MFSPPKYPLVFCVFVGTGLQLLHLAVATAGFAALGFLSPANRGSMMLGALFLFCVFAAGGGCNAALYVQQQQKILQLVQHDHFGSECALLRQECYANYYFCLRGMVTSTALTLKICSGTLKQLLINE